MLENTLTQPSPSTGRGIFFVMGKIGISRKLKDAKALSSF
jgi:hypothetical protein